MPIWFGFDLDLNVTNPHVPLYALDGTISSDQSAESQATACVDAALLAALFLTHAYRTSKGLYTRSFGRALGTFVLSSLLRVAAQFAEPEDVPSLNGVGNLVVGSWVLGLVGDSYWLVAMFKVPRRAVCNLLSGTTLALVAAAMMLLFEPLHVVHHVASATLGASAVVATTSRSDNFWVRLAAAFHFATTLGPLAWDTPSSLVRAKPDTTALWCYTTSAQLGFVVCVLCSYRFRRSGSNELPLTGAGPGKYT